jgi:cell fate regulator YaaT (PSP1 superfamily)
VTDNEAVLEQGEGNNHYYRVKVLHSSETEICTVNDGVQIHSENGGGELVVLQTKYGKDMGRILGRITAEEPDDNDVFEILRVATEKDLQTYKENLEREIEALEICREKVEARRLEMKLVSAHYIPEESKVLFFFTAENRVDFRELVKDLVAVFKMRIELRQIGVRDESRVLGGIGVCGRPFCCHGVTDKLKPVSIKMAKEQNLSLNSMKISGPCGRLLCCLSYEYDLYREAKKNLPCVGHKVCYNSHFCKITDVNVLTRNVKILDTDGKVLDLPAHEFSYDKQEKTWNVSAEK